MTTPKMMMNSIRTAAVVLLAMTMEPSTRSAPGARPHSGASRRKSKAWLHLSLLDTTLFNN